MGYGNGGASGSMTASSLNPAPQRQSVIAEQMNTLEQRTEVLNSTVAELEARISAVLMPEPPASNEKSPGAPIQAVALGASLGSMNDRIALVTRRLRSIIDRVEL